MQAAQIKTIGQVGVYKKVTKIRWEFATSAYIAQQTEYVRVCVCVWCISRLKLSETKRFLITNSFPFFITQNAPLETDPFSRRSQESGPVMSGTPCSTPLGKLKEEIRK
jgi:hypothetical protein